MRLLIAVQGQWGGRIAHHLCQTAPGEWCIHAWQAPSTFPMVLDDPEAFLPDVLPPADLLLALTESAGLTDLVPDLAHLCRAQAAIIPVDRHGWAAPGLIRQAKRRLEASGVASAWPAPFCSLTPGMNQHPLIRQFAQRFGRPEVRCLLHDGRVTSCQVLREAPCGNTRYVAEGLVGTGMAQAAERAGLLHHYYPCWGGMEVDPVQGQHTLLHIAATISQKAVQRAIDQGETT